LAEWHIPASSLLTINKRSVGLYPNFSARVCADASGESIKRKESEMTDNLSIKQAGRFKECNGL